MTSTRDSVDRLRERIFEKLWHRQVKLVEIHSRAVSIAQKHLSLQVSVDRVLKNGKSDRTRRSEDHLRDSVQTAVSSVLQMLATANTLVGQREDRVTAARDKLDGLLALAAKLGFSVVQINTQ